MTYFSIQNSISANKNEADDGVIAWNIELAQESEPTKGIPKWPLEFNFFCTTPCTIEIAKSTSINSLNESLTIIHFIVLEFWKILFSSPLQLGPPIMLPY